MNALRDTSLEIRARVRTHRASREERLRVQQPIRAIDALLTQLEELHLAGKTRVPEWFDGPLGALNGELPDELRQSLRCRITIAHLMDQLFDIQDQLLQRKAGIAPDAQVEHPVRRPDPAAYLPRAS